MLAGYETLFGRRRARVIHWMELLPVVEAANTPDEWKKKRSMVHIRRADVKIDGILNTDQQILLWECDPGSVKGAVLLFIFIYLLQT